MIASGFITVESAFSASETLERLRSAVAASGNTVFSSIDHAGAAEGVGLSLLPTTVISFGNPAAGTKLMQINQAVGIDLPLKILVWEDESNKVNVSYNDPRGLNERYGLGSGSEAVITAMSGLLASLAQKAAAKQRPAIF